MSESLLSLQSLTIAFGNRMAVENVSFQINKGKTLGVVGESGSGKSLTALSLPGLLPEGAKILSGKALMELKSGEQTDLFTLKNLQKIRGKEIAFIFQEPMTSLNPVLTCGFQVLEAVRLHHLSLSSKEAFNRTLDFFNEVKLPRPESIFNAYPHQISGGQKQRVMIAMALACEPALLIADEPTTALDVTVQKTILDLLLQLKESRKLSLLFISHDLGVVADIADEVAVMYKGSIVEAGPTVQVFSNPVHEYTSGLLKCRPPLNRTLDRLPVLGADNISVDKMTEPSDLRSQSLDSAEILAEARNIFLKFNLSGGPFWKKKKQLVALNNVFLYIKEGETFGLVGESGSGKTTLGRILSGLLAPSSGEVLYRNQSILGLSGSEWRALRKKIQIIFQDPYGSLPPHMTVAEILTEPMKIHHPDRNRNLRTEKAAELMHKTGLSPDWMNRYPRQFSGGQRQRISIARALAVEPEFIVCDESVSALDVSVQAQILNLLKDLREEFNLTYLFISHDLSVIRFMADRVAVLQNGTIIEEGSCEQIISAPRSDYARTLIESVPKITF